MDVFAEIFAEISVLKKQVARVIRPGTAGAQDGNFFEIDVGEGDPIRARQKGLAVGDFKIHIGVSEDEPVTLFCPNGDARDAFFFPGDWTGKASNPSGKRNELMIERGGNRFVMRDDYMMQQVGGVKIETTPDGVFINGNLVVNGDVDLNGGHVKNDGVAIDKTHQHKDTMPGSGLSGVPNG